MHFTIKIAVTAGRATLLQMPDLSEGSDGVVALAVSFDESWDGFLIRAAILWREGEAVLRLPLAPDGTADVPTVFTMSDRPFLLRLVGEGEECGVQTNEICLRFDKLHSLDATDPQYTVYAGQYTLTENKTYPLRDCLMAKDLTVCVPTTDTSADTVTPESLLPGVTAHDAAGNLIVGAYVNPYNADTTGDTVSPQTLHLGTTAHDAGGNAIRGTYTNPYNADTTADTVTPQTLFTGVTAHAADGSQIIGTYSPPDKGFVNLVMSQAKIEGGTTAKED